MRLTSLRGKMTKSGKCTISKLTGENLTQAINSRTVTLVRYGGGFIDWRKQELQDLYPKTRSLLTTKKGFYQRDCVARLYAPRKEGGRGLMSEGDCVKQARISKGSYVQSHIESSQGVRS